MRAGVSESSSQRFNTGFRGLPSPFYLQVFKKQKQNPEFESYLNN